MERRLVPMATTILVVVVVVVLAGCQRTALAKPQLTFSSSSVGDEVGRLTESRHNKVKSVAGQHLSGFVRQAQKSERTFRAAKPAEAALSFDGPLKGLGEIPLVRELGSLILPRLEEALKGLNEANKSDPPAARKLELNDIQKESPAKEEKKIEQEQATLLAALGKAVFGSKPDGSDGLLNEDTLKITQILQQFASALPSSMGNLVASVAKIVDHTKPLNTINQFGAGLLKGARSAQEQPATLDFNRLLKEALAGEPKEQVNKLFESLSVLLDEGVFLGLKKQGQQKPKQQQQQEQQQRSLEEDVFF